MGRRKLEIKRIEDKNSRQVAFSKRRNGLMKKARQLSVLCDIDVAVVVVSGRGKLYEFCSSATSLDQILKRYESSSLESEAGTAIGACEAKEISSKSQRFRTSEELLEMVQRYAEEPCIEQLNVPDLAQLEEDLYSALIQTRLRKTQLMMEYVKSLHEKEKELHEKNKRMEQKVAEMKIGGKVDNNIPDLNVLAASSEMISGAKRMTLPLFTN